MSVGVASAGAAQAAAMMNAVRSFGVIVTVEPDDFQLIVGLQDEALIVTAIGGFFVTQYRYLVSFKGLAFFTKSSIPLEFPQGTLTINAKKLLLPG